MPVPTIPNRPAGRCHNESARYSLLQQESLSKCLHRGSTAVYSFPRMPKKADQAPATKRDIKLLMDQIGTYYQRTERGLDEMATRTDHRLDEMEAKMERWKAEIVEHFDLVVENIRHDLAGAHLDRFAAFDDRLTRLERHTGLAR